MAIVVVRVLAVGWLSACTFAHGTAPEQRGGSQSPDDAGGGSQPVDAARDAKVFLDSPAVVGSLVVTVQTMGSQDVNLSSEGTADWAHWGYGNKNAFDHKNGANLIGNLASGPDGSFTGSPLTASWTGGTPTSSASQTSSGVWVQNPSAMTFTVPASTTSRTLRVYVGVQDADARLDVSLSDSSATAASMTLSKSSGTMNVQYTIVYNAASAGQTLTVSWTDTHDYSGSPLSALLFATLQ